MSRIPALVLACAASTWLLVALPEASPEAASDGRGAAHPLFTTADACIACHTGLVTPTGEDVSMAAQWRPTMMANSARDPYWQAAVRREVLDHPQAQALIEDECSACHMPMARYEAKVAGHEGIVFGHLPIGHSAARDHRLAADGASCSVCHQIDDEGLGERSSFTAGFHVDTTRTAGQRRIFGPFEVDAGRTRIMESASDFVPTAAAHISRSEVCASCHTLFTQAFGPKGEVVGELPEQVPYLEWRHSAYREERSCQSCHMPEVTAPTPISAVWGEPRAGLSRHVFQGGNFFMARLLNRYRADLGVEASPQELDATAQRTVHHLATEAARVSVRGVERRGARVEADVVVENLAGHKLPTAYPSRRAWLHVTVRDQRDAVVFESGAFRPDGQIAGNDNDADATRFEPHHAEIARADQVQIYEAIMADHAGAVTTGLLSAVRYLKDNRLLPRGFDKATAPGDVAVRGAATADADFAANGDRVRYVIDLPEAHGPYRLEVELWYQPIAYRWAHNLGRHRAPETDRFVPYYESMASTSAVVLATAAAGLP